MKQLFILSLCIFGISSCFKKSNEIPNFTTNIFDEDYTGDKWFNSDGYQQLMLQDSTQFLRFYFSIKEESMPTKVDGFIPGIATVKVSNNGNGVSRSPFNIYYDIFDLTIGQSHCFSIGVNDVDTVINEFDECVNYDG